MTENWTVSGCWSGIGCFENIVSV